MTPIAAVAHPLLGQRCLHCLGMLLSQEAMAKVFCLRVLQHPTLLLARLDTSSSDLD